MPKIRKKQKLITTDGYVKKSGILTRSLKSIIKKENVRKNFFKDILLHESDYLNNNIIPYNDNNTILFVSKNVNPVFTIEDKYKNNNRILHTPNEFNTDFKQQRLVEKEVYEKFLSPNYDTFIREKAFNDNKLCKKEDLELGKEVVNINLVFNEPCKLSFNESSLSLDDLGNQLVRLNNSVYKKRNAPVAYYNFEDNSWEYLGNIDDLYFKSISRLKESPIAFNSLNTLNNHERKNCNLGIPVNTFGFPFDSKFKGMNRHLYSLANHINAPFTLEEIKINLEVSNLSEVEATKAREIINSLNFFVLNQRKNLNSNSFINLGLDHGKIHFYNSTSSEIDEDNLTYNINTNPVFSKIINPGSTSESIATYTGSESGVTSFDEDQASQRELVSYLTIVNYTSGSLNSENIDIENIKENSDYFFEKTDGFIDINTKFDTNYTRRKIEVKGICRTPVFHNRLEKITNHDVYASSTFKNRSGTIYRTERSFETDYGLQDETVNISDDFGIEIDLSKKSYKENQYTLLPSDNLIFGFSFNPTLSFENNSISSKDICFIHDKINISLIGRYYQNKSPVKLSEKNYFKNNVKRINVFENKNCFDDIGFNNIYLNKGAYYDGYYYQVVSAGIPSLGIAPVVFEVRNIDSGLVFSTFRNPKTFTGFIPVRDENIVLMDKISENSTSERKKYYLFKLDSFGQQKSFYHGYKNYAYKDIKTKKNYFFINKKSINKYFEDVSIDETMTYNKDEHARITQPFSFKE